MEEIKATQTSIHIAPSKLWGTAIETVHIDGDGYMWVENGEYATRVNYNPFTGEPAPSQMVGVEKQMIKNDDSIFRYIDYRD